MGFAAELAPPSQGSTSLDLASHGRPTSPGLDAHFSPPFALPGAEPVVGGYLPYPGSPGPRAPQAGTPRSRSPSPASSPKRLAFADDVAAASQGLSGAGPLAAASGAAGPRAADVPTEALKRLGKLEEEVQRLRTDVSAASASGPGSSVAAALAEVRPSLMRDMELRLADHMQALKACILEVEAEARANEAAMGSPTSKLQATAEEAVKVHGMVLDLNSQLGLLEDRVRTTERVLADAPKVALEAQGLRAREAEAALLEAVDRKLTALRLELSPAEGVQGAEAKLAEALERKLANLRSEMSAQILASSSEVVRRIAAQASWGADEGLEAKIAQAVEHKTSNLRWELSSEVLAACSEMVKQAVVQSPRPADAGPSGAALLNLNAQLGALEDRCRQVVELANVSVEKVEMRADALSLALDARISADEELERKFEALREDLTAKVLGGCATIERRLEVLPQQAQEAAMRRVADLAQTVDAVRNEVSVGLSAIEERIEVMPRQELELKFEALREELTAKVLGGCATIERRLEVLPQQAQEAAMRRVADLAQTVDALRNEVSAGLTTIEERMEVVPRQAQEAAMRRVADLAQTVDALRNEVSVGLTTIEERMEVVPRQAREAVSAWVVELDRKLEAIRAELSAEMLAARANDLKALRTDLAESHTSRAQDLQAVRMDVCAEVMAGRTRDAQELRAELAAAAGVITAEQQGALARLGAVEERLAFLAQHAQKPAPGLEGQILSSVQQDLSALQDHVRRLEAVLSQMHAEVASARRAEPGPQVVLHGQLSAQLDAVQQQLAEGLELLRGELSASVERLDEQLWRTDDLLNGRLTELEASLRSTGRRSLQLKVSTGSQDSPAGEAVAFDSTGGIEHRSDGGGGGPRFGASAGSPASSETRLWEVQSPGATWLPGASQDSDGTRARKGTLALRALAAGTYIPPVAAGLGATGGSANARGRSALRSLDGSKGSLAFEPVAALALATV